MIAFNFAQGPFRISTAEDGPSALAFLHAHPDVELVMADVNLPGKSGLDVMEEARADATLHQVPWLVLTGTGDTAHLDRAKALGAAAIVTKPYSPRKLVRLVSELVGEPVGPEETR
jgi:CheY-like chemotaxis protein